jgi:hypothetical protein
MSASHEYWILYPLMSFPGLIVGLILEGIGPMTVNVGYIVPTLKNTDQILSISFEMEDPIQLCMVLYVIYNLISEGFLPPKTKKLLM